MYGLRILMILKLYKMASHKELIPLIKRLEGGYVNHPLDKGGCTNSGITISAYRYAFGKSKTCEDLKNMKDEEWEYIFKTNYWDRFRADEINNQSVANICVDYVWASGVYGIKYIQQILGVTADGIVGKKTLAALNGYKNQKQLFEKIWARRKYHFETIVKRNPSQKVFLRGWLRRLDAFKYKE